MSRTLLALALATMLPTLARADDAPEAEAETAAEVTAPEPEPEPEAKPKPAWRREKHMVEVGWLMGALFPAADHGLYGVQPPSPPRELKTGFLIGLRLAYLPFRFVGIELEGDVSPTRVDITDGKRTVLFGLRGHVLLQLPTRLTPFIVAGGGMLGGSSQDDLIGKKIGPALHVGGGLKYYVNKWVAIRIDGRDVMSPSYAQAAGGPASYAHSAEFTIGVNFVWGRKSPKMWPKG